jgi:dihydrofolate synthase/folylpolyglutamate synthase
MTYPDALSYLGQTRRFGMKLGLEPMRELARALGDPHEKLRFIHLAGTNGKGSTAAFCESCLRAAGFRVGLYTSPHLVSVRERIQIDRQLISEVDFAEGMGIIRQAIESMKDPATTFFEITTALALWYFARKKVDWVVWETGLGGRLDATNIVTPEICIITNIGLDHQQYLGQTLAEIAAEKAGIIKPGVPVVSCVVEEAAKIIEWRAKSLQCEFISVANDVDGEHCRIMEGKQLACIGHRIFRLGLLGMHQAFNAACATAAIEHLEHIRCCSNRSGDPALVLHDPGPPGGWTHFNSIWSGLEDTRWPGRFEILSEKPLIVLDGAHNPAAVKMLVSTWRAFLAARYGWSEHEIKSRARLVFASVADKDISEMARLLGPLAREVSLVRLANERSAEPAQLAPFFTGLPCACYDSVSALWQDLVSADAESVTLVTGSLFLVGELLAQRQGNAEEYRLNERLENFTPVR